VHLVCPVSTFVNKLFVSTEGQMEGCWSPKYANGGEVQRKPSVLSQKNRRHYGSIQVQVIFACPMNMFRLWTNGHWKSWVSGVWLTQVYLENGHWNGAVCSDVTQRIYGERFILKNNTSCTHGTDHTTSHQHHGLTATGSLGQTCNGAMDMLDYLRDFLQQTWLTTHDDRTATN